MANTLLAKFIWFRLCQAVEIRSIKWDFAWPQAGEFYITITVVSNYSEHSKICGRGGLLQWELTSIWFQKIKIESEEATVHWLHAVFARLWYYTIAGWTYTTLNNEWLTLNRKTIVVKVNSINFWEITPHAWKDLAIHDYEGHWSSLLIVIDCALRVSGSCTYPLLVQERGSKRMLCWKKGRRFISKNQPIVVAARSRKHQSQSWTIAN